MLLHLGYFDMVNVLVHAVAGLIMITGWAYTWPFT